MGKALMPNFKASCSARADTSHSSMESVRQPGQIENALVGFGGQVRLLTRDLQSGLSTGGIQGIAFRVDLGDGEDVGRALWYVHDVV